MRQTLHSSFPIPSYGETQTNFLANPIIPNCIDKRHFRCKRAEEHTWKNLGMWGWEILTHQEMAPRWISTKNIHAKDKPAQLCAHLPPPPPHSQQHFQARTPTTKIAMAPNKSKPVPFAKLNDA